MNKHPNDHDSQKYEERLIKSTIALDALTLKLKIHKYQRFLYKHDTGHLPELQLSGVHPVSLNELKELGTDNEEKSNEKMMVALGETPPNEEEKKLQNQKKKYRIEMPESAIPGRGHCQRRLAWYEWQLERQQKYADNEDDPDDPLCWECAFADGPVGQNPDVIPSMFESSELIVPTGLP